MSGRFQTPASKRFLPPSSSSRAQQSSSSSLRKAHTGNPSDPSSSSPFVRTPFPRKVLNEDDIETSFEERSDSPSALPSQIEPILPRANKHDYIEDEEGGASSELDDALEPQPLANDTAGGDTEDVYEDVEILPQRSTDSHRADFTSPLPKRQKTSNFTSPSKGAKGLISILSSDDEHFSDNPVSNSPREDADRQSGIETITNNISRDDHESHTKRPRFKILPTGDNEPSHENERPKLRSAFKDLTTAGATWKDSPLPVTFSPSKRRGRYEYIQGGAAETVRNWILDIANDHSDVSQGNSQQLDTTPVSADDSGRFEIVNDSQGQAWMLVHQENQTEMLGASGESGAEMNRAIVIKGSRTTWSLEVPGLVIGHEAIDTLRLAVLWDLKPKEK